MGDARCAAGALHMMGCKGMWRAPSLPITCVRQAATYLGVTTNTEGGRAPRSRLWLLTLLPGCVLMAVPVVGVAAGSVVGV